MDFDGTTKGTNDPRPQSFYSLVSNNSNRAFTSLSESAQQGLNNRFSLGSAEKDLDSELRLLV